MDWNIKKFKSVGPIVFGSERNEVRKHFQEEPKVYAQTEAVVPHDTYEDLGLFVMYDKYNRCAAVEFMKPHKLIWEGKNLFGMSSRDALNLLYQHDATVVVSDKDFTSFNLGISVFAPEKETNPKAAIASITIFRKDHFNQKIGIADPAVFSTFVLQVGSSQLHPVGSFSSLDELWKNSFGSQEDYLWLYWNSQPLAIPYSEIHALAPTWLLLLNDLSERNQGKEVYHLNSKAMEVVWDVQWDDNYISIISTWKRAFGMEGALNYWSELKVLKSDFVSEWTLVLHQLSQGIHSLNPKATKGEGGVLLEILTQLVYEANEPGRWYKKESQLQTKFFEPQG